MLLKFLFVTCSFLLICSNSCNAKLNPIEEYISEELNKARDIMKKGFPPHIPELDPLEIKSFNESEKILFFNFTLEMFNIYLPGLSQFRIANISANETAIQLALDLDFPRNLTAVGNFTLVDKILPTINGEFKIALVDPLVSLSLSVAIGEYIQINKYDFDYKFAGVEVTVTGIVDAGISKALSDLLTREAPKALNNEKAAIKQKLDLVVALINSYLQALKPQ